MDLKGGELHLSGMTVYSTQRRGRRRVETRDADGWDGND